MSIAKTPSATTTRDLKDLTDKGILTKTGTLKSTRYGLNLAPFYPAVSQAKDIKTALRLSRDL